jgi:hypothetical protein
MQFIFDLDIAPLEQHNGAIFLEEEMAIVCYTRKTNKQ